MGANATSREWYRPNPPLPSIKWGPRNNTNIQESALLIALNYVAKNRETFLENYWLKNKRAVNKGRNEAPYAWVIPAAQRRKAEAADLVNALRRQGLEISQATAAFKAGSVDVAAGDYVIRADQPYRTMADMYFSLQNYAPGNPRPYDDTGWTMQLMRNVKLMPVADKGVQAQPMTLVAADVKAPGGIEGTGPVLVVDHTSDNSVVTFRFKHADVKMLAAEEDFTLAGHKFRAGAFIIPNADRAKLEPTLKDLGPVGVGRGERAGREDARPRRAAHRLRALVVEHAERRLGARAPSTTSACRTRTSATSSCAKATCARSTT